MSGDTATLQGYYRWKGDRKPTYMKVDGEKASWHEGGKDSIEMTLEYGEFSPAPDILRRATGRETCNMKLTTEVEGWEDVSEGVVSEDGKTAFFSNRDDTILQPCERITEDEAKKLDSDLGDPISAPPGPYKVQPQVKGRFLWINGAPGLGKSTTAQLLAREKGFVYYEMDCFFALRNPYIPPVGDNPTMLSEEQRNLTGEGREEREQIIQRGLSPLEKIRMKETLSREEEMLVEKLYKALCDDIRQERRRIGGDWAVAGVIQTKQIRDIIRKFLGPDLVIVNLTMPKEKIEERLRKRHAKEGEAILEWLMSYFDEMEAQKVEKDEENVMRLEITGEMSKMEIMNLVLERTEKKKMIVAEDQKPKSKLCTIL